MSGAALRKASVIAALPAVVLVAICVDVFSQGDVNQRNPDGSTPLQWAAYEGNAVEVRRLIGAGADVSLANDYGATPMSLAAEVADTEVLKLLLAAGANADSPNAEGMTALMAVARTGNVEAAKLLLEYGATVDAREGFGGQTALMWAAARRHPQMIELLVANGAAIDARSAARDYQRHITAEGRPKSLDSGGFTPLLYAARENCGACVDVLLAKGADIDVADPDGVSPLHIAVMNANWDLAKKLVEAGADVDQWDIFGAAPLFTAVGLRSRVDGGRASIDAPNEASGLDLVRLLLERGANPNMQLFFRPANVRGATNTRGSTPLIRAANNNDLEVVKLLLEHGADATVYMADRQTPIHAVLAGRASEQDALELISVLHDAGTDVNVVALVNHIEEVRGGSALHYAVRKRYKDVIRLLASYGIDMNLKDQDGLTALDYTQSRGFMAFMALQTPLFEEEAALLRELGATVLMAKAPVWPVLGPPQGMWPDIWPVGEPVEHAPIYTHRSGG
jgi:ankyrin repeat protein